MRIRFSIVALAMVFGRTVLPAAVTYDSIYWAPPLDVVGTKIVNANGYAVQLKGFAVTEPTAVTRSLIAHFRNDWKITMLRLPMIIESGHAWVPGNIFVNNSYMAATDSALKWCRDNHIYVLFDGWHEGGQGNTITDWSSTVAAWRIMADRYKNQDHILWEIFNEPHSNGTNNVTWATWVPMAQQLIDTIRARNPVVKAVVAGTVNWCQQTGVPGLKINRDKVIYSWHPYGGIYGSNDSAAWEKNFGFIMTSGVAPVFASEWGFTSQQDSAGYGTQLIKYMKGKGISWTGWCYSQSWAPQMLSSENPEVRNPSGNLMYKAFHDTVPVVAVTETRNSAAASVVPHDVVIDNSMVRFTCVQASPVTLSVYSADGRLVSTVVNRTFAKGTYSLRWDALLAGVKAAQSLYLVRFEIDKGEYHSSIYCGNSDHR